MHMRLFGILTVLVAGMALMTAACGGDDDAPATATTTTQAAPTDTPGTSATETPGTATGEIPSEISITAENISFDKASLTIKAGVATTITMTNKDSIAHNFHVMAGSVDEAITPPFTAADSPQTLTVTIDTPGSYTFQCDVHPTTMNGTIEVVG